MYLDPVIPMFVMIVLALSVMSVLAYILKQPAIIGYIFAGIILGPFGLKVITNTGDFNRLGSAGVIFLLFFVGLHISPEKLMKNWRISFIGTILQIFISVAVVLALGYFLNWPLNRCILLGFVISLSSTAVVLNLLERNKSLNTIVGQDILGITLVQDLAVIPMLIIISVLGEGGFDGAKLLLQGLGTAFLSVLVYFVVKTKGFSFPFGKIIQKDRELQVLISLVVCFGLALITGMLELSAGLGAFVAGMIIGSSKDTEWVQENLHSFRVVFMALFFVSIGLLIDFQFFQRHWIKIVILVVFVVTTNTFINAITIRVLGRSWKSSLYSGAMLSQIGEFSFMLAAIGLQTSMVTQFGYQMTIATIALSLMLSPFWIGLVSKILKIKKNDFEVGAT